MATTAIQLNPLEYEIKPIDNVDARESALLRTNSAGLAAFEKLDFPGLDRLGEERITQPPVHQAIAVESAAGKTSSANVALAIIMLALGREKIGSEKLKDLSGQIKEKLRTIDDLLELQGKLPSDQDSYKLNGEMKGLLDKLEKKGIVIWKGEGEISKEQHGELKAEINTQIDKLRTAIQTTISTEIQPEVHALQSIMNAVSEAMRCNRKLIELANRLPGR